MIAQQHVLTIRELSKLLEGHEATRTPSAPCAGVFLHHGALLGHAVQHDDSRLSRRSKVGILFAIDLRNGHFKTIGTTSRNAGQQHGNSRRLTEEAIHRLIEVDVLRTGESTAEHVVDVERLDALSTVVDNSHLLLDGGVHHHITGLILLRSCCIVSNLATAECHLNGRAHTHQLREVEPLEELTACVQVESACIRLHEYSDRILIDFLRSIIYGKAIAHVNAFFRDDIGLVELHGDESSLSIGDIDADEVGHVHSILNTQLTGEPHLDVADAFGSHQREGDAFDIAADNGLVLHLDGYIIRVLISLAEAVEILLACVEAVTDIATYVRGIDIGIVGRSSVRLHLGT